MAGGRPRGSPLRRVTRSALRAGGQGRPPLRCCVTKKSVGEGLCPSRGRGNRRSAAGGGCSEPVSRKCPDWRTRQWPGIGWHDGGQENPAPTEAQQEVQWAGDRKGRPYESGTRSVTSIGRADVGIGPYGENLGRTKGKSKRIPKYPLAFSGTKESEVLDDVNDFSTNALLSL